MAMESGLPKLISDIDRYKDIWSQENNEPLIYVNEIHFSKKDMQIMGKNKDPIKIVKNGVAYMKFFAKDMIEELNELNGDLKMSVIGRAHMNEWMGTVTPQIFIDEYEAKEDRLIDF